MASYLRPRRGKKSTAESQALVLKRGEVFFECPDTGVGTGAGKIKVGDGSTAYSTLPYFLGDVPEVEDCTIGFTDSSSATDKSNNPTYLTNIAPANSLKTIFTNLKQLLYNYNSQLTQLNNDITNTINKDWTTPIKIGIITLNNVQKTVYRKLIIKKYILQSGNNTLVKFSNDTDLKNSVILNFNAYHLFYDGFGYVNGYANGTYSETYISNNSYIYLGMPEAGIVLPGTNTISYVTIYYAK